MEAIFSILTFSLKNIIPIAEMIVIPAAPHIAYATLIGIFFTDNDKKAKHIPYDKSEPKAGNNFENPSDIFRKVVAKVSSTIAKIK